MSFYKRILTFSLTIIVLGILVAPNFLMAAPGDAPAAPATDPLLDNLKSAAEVGAQYNTVNTDTVPQIIGQIVAVALGFVGSIFFIMIIYSGFQWMTAGGNEEKVKQSRTRLINSIIGLTFVVAAYFLTWLIKVTLLGA